MMHFKPAHVIRILWLKPIHPRLHGFQAVQCPVDQVPQIQNQRTENQNDQTTLGAIVLFSNSNGLTKAHSFILMVFYYEC